MLAVGQDHALQLYYLLFIPIYHFLKGLVLLVVGVIGPVELVVEPALFRREGKEVVWIALLVLQLSRFKDRFLWGPELDRGLV